MTMPNETPEEFAERICHDIATWEAGRDHDEDEWEAFHAELAATKRDAEAMPYWKAEALAGNRLASGDPDAADDWHKARTARINAGLT